jgi:hypothetical protein
MTTTANSRVASVFDYAGHEIRLEVSMFSGREWLYLDDQLLEKKLNLTSCRSTFQFALDGQSAEVRLQAKGLAGALTGHYGVELFVGGVLTDCDEFNYTQLMVKDPKKRRGGLSFLALCMAAGFVFGTIVAMLFKH